MRTEMLFARAAGQFDAERAPGRYSGYSSRRAHVGVQVSLLLALVLGVECYAQATGKQQPGRDKAGAAASASDVNVKILGPDGKSLTGTRAFNLRGLGTFTEQPIATDELRVPRPPSGRKRLIWFNHEQKKLAGAITISGDSSGSVTAKLLAWGVISGRVVDEKGNPRPGLMVHLKSGPRSGPPELEERATLRGPVGRDGRYRLEGVIPGLDYHMFIVDTAISFAHWGPEFNLNPGETKELAVVVTREVSLPVNGRTSGRSAGPAPRLVTQLEDSKDFDEYWTDFRDEHYDMRWLKIDGPAGLARLVRPEKKGLRFSIPAGLGQGPSVATKFGVRGDFEITAAFEALSREHPKVGWGIGPELYIKPPGGWEKFASMGRFLRISDTVYCMVHGFKAGDEKKMDAFVVPNEAVSGRFRLIRKGATVYFQAAEGQSEAFRELFQTEFGTQDLEFVRISVTTGESQNPADALWKDLSIRAEELTGWAGTHPRAKRATWKVAAVGIPATLLLGLIGLVWWRGASHRRRTVTGGTEVGGLVNKPASRVKNHPPGGGHELESSREWDESALASMEAAAVAIAQAHPDQPICLKRPRFQFSVRGGSLHGRFVAWRPLDEAAYDRLGSSWEEVRGKIPLLFEGAYLDGKRHGPFSYHNEAGRIFVRKYRKGKVIT